MQIIIRHSNSLKDKRMVIRKIKEKVFSKFKIPVYEIDYQDVIKEGRIAFSLISNETVKMMGILDKVILYIKENCEAEAYVQLRDTIKYDD